MRTALIAIVASAACTASLFAGEPKLANPKPVFAASQPAYKQEKQYHVFAMRLSPDGERLLYTRPVAGTDETDYKTARYELLLRQLDSGKEVVLPVEPSSTGWRTVYTRFNMFDPKGERLALPSKKVEIKQHADGHGYSGYATTNLLMYDIVRGKSTDCGVIANHTMAKFTADGKSLVTSGADDKKGQLATDIVSLKGMKRTALSAPGYVQSVCPAGDVAAFYHHPRVAHVPPTSTFPAPGERRQRPADRLILWDLKADKEIVQLPTHPRNSVLDDLETQWTSDGRYLYYCDLEDAAPGAPKGASTIEVTRVWDRQTGKVVESILEAVPVGPGPGVSQMVLARRTQDGSGGFVLHDVAIGTLSLGDKSQHAIHASGGKVVYAQQKPGDEREVIYVADVLMTKGTLTKP